MAKTTNANRVMTSLLLGTAVNLLSCFVFIGLSAVAGDVVFWLLLPFTAVTYVMVWRKTPQIFAWMGRES